MQRIQTVAIDNAPEASKPVVEKIKAARQRGDRVIAVDLLVGTILTVGARFSFRLVEGTTKRWSEAGMPVVVLADPEDAELAVRLGKFPGAVLFTGGAKDMSGRDDLTPEELAHEHDKYAPAWDMLLESVVKGVAAMMVSVNEPREILLSGRLTGISEIAGALRQKLSSFGSVRRVQARAGVAKLAAEGAYIIGEGLMGGKYRGIVDCLKLREASGTMFDHILLKGVQVERP